MELPEHVHPLQVPSKNHALHRISWYILVPLHTFTIFYHVVRRFGGPRSTQKSWDHCDIDDSTPPWSSRVPLFVASVGPAGRVTPALTDPRRKTVGQQTLNHTKKWPNMVIFHGTSWGFMLDRHHPATWRVGILRVNHQSTWLRMCKKTYTARCSLVWFACNKGS